MLNPYVFEFFGWLGNNRGKGGNYRGEGGRREFQLSGPSLLLSIGDYSLCVNVAVPASSARPGSV